MSDENKPGERRALSMEEAVSALRDSREEQPDAETTEDEPEAETEEVIDAEPEVEAEAEDAEAEADAEPDDQPEEEAEEEAEPEAGDDAVYEVGGVEFTLAELKQWRENGLREADYTRKRQADAEARKEFDAERATWDAERGQVIEHLRQQETQLRDALATFAIEQDHKPKRADFPSTDDYLVAADEWAARAEKRDEAKRAYQALQEHQQLEVAQREGAQLLRLFPEWRDPAVFKDVSDRIGVVAGEYGITADEMSAITDHRMIRVLHDLQQLKAAASTREATVVAAKKKAGKALKPLAAGSKPAKNQGEKDLRQKRDRLRNSGKRGDAVALLQAKRAARSSV